MTFNHIRSKIEANINFIIFMVRCLNKREPLLWGFNEYLVNVLRGNPSLLHLGDDVLQDVGVAMTSVLHLGNNNWE